MKPFFMLKIADVMVVHNSEVV